MGNRIFQNALFSSGQLVKEKEYWLKKLSGKLVKCGFVYDYVKPEDPSREDDRINFQIPARSAVKMINLSNGSDIRLFMILAAGLKGLLYKYSGIEDIIIGAPIYREEVEGEFLNTVLTLRDHLDHGMTFKELLLQIKQTLNEAEENGNYPVDLLLNELEISAPRDSHPLFEIVLLLENIHDEKYVEGVNSNLLWSFKKNGESITGFVKYKTRFYMRSSIERIINHFINFLQRSLENVNLTLGEIEILSKEEFQQLSVFNNAIEEYPKNQTIHQLFEEQVAKNPEKIAVIVDHEMVSYRKLNGKINQLAGVLRDRGVGRDCIVGIMVERSLEMVIGILGILKAGGAYLPIDLRYPNERIKYLLRDSGAGIVLTQQHLLRERFPTHIQFLNLDEESFDALNHENLQNINGARDLAYIIYTSGSTGNPKGVMIEHQSVINILFALQKKYPLLDSDAFLLKTTYSFDVSVTELFGWFLGNGRLVILEKDAENNPAIITKTIDKYNVTHINFVPSMLNAFLNAVGEAEIRIINKLKYIFVAGEVLSGEIVRKLFLLTRKIRLENIYGPTETTIYATSYSCLNVSEEEFDVPIGKPFPNTKVHIVDKTNNLVPVGAVGELCIAGNGLARGYLNKSDLTIEKFSANPFSPGERMYRTGDLGKWLSDGNIQFFGRVDHQVKIRGYRIELGEIESKLLKFKGVKEAVVDVQEEETGNKYLCGYLVSDQTFTVHALREFLADELPDYMIPVHFYQLDKIPLTSNGKVDRLSLPGLGQTMPIGTEYTAPRDQLEEKLVAIWEEILGQKLGINDNFFVLGGHSLNAILITSRINQEFEVELPMMAIFENPSVKMLAKVIKEMTFTKFSPIVPVEEREFYPLSSAQRRLYFLDQVEGPSIKYNMPSVFRIEGNLDLERLDRAFQELVKRHETLRTTFELLNGEPRQRIHSETEFKITSLQADDDRLNKIIDSFIQPFDLCKAPLMRIALVKLSDQKQLLLFDIHHLVCDGTSLAILFREFVSFYEGKTLPPPPIRYRDYTVWHNNFLKSEVIKRQEKYWLAKLGGFSYTELPRKNVLLQEKDQQSSKFLTLDKQLRAALENFCNYHNLTKFVYLLTVFQIILSKETGQNDISIGIPVAGRFQRDVQELVGLFLNILIIRSNVNNSYTFRELLDVVKDTVVEAQNNQFYPYEELYFKLKEEFDFRGQSLFSIMFNYINNLESETVVLDEITLRPSELPEIEPKYDLTVYLYEKKDEINLKLTYKANLYDDFLMEAILSGFVNVLNLVLSNQAIFISEITQTASEPSDVFQGTFEDGFENEEFFV